MRKLGVAFAGLALLAAACTTVGSDESAQAPVDTTTTPTVSATSPGSTVAAPPSTTTTTTIAPAVAETTTTTAPATTTTQPQLTTTVDPEPEPVLTEPAAAPDSTSASVVGGTPIVIGQTDQDVEISVYVEFTPDGYCELFFLFVTCGWDFHESPDWDGSTFTPLDVSTYTATETLPFPSSDGDTKVFYFTYGYGEFLGFGDSGNQTISILVSRSSG